MSFSLLIIRHAESTNNRIAEATAYEEFVATRTYDPEITERGHEQAKALARHLAESTQREFARTQPVYPQGYGITRLVASPMIRTLLTATPVAHALGLPLEVWTDIFEQGGLFEGNPMEGRTLRSYPGSTRAEFESRFPGIVLPPEVTERGWWRGGYEEMDICAERAAGVALRLKRIAAAHPADAPAETLAMVTHGTFINQLIHALLGLPDESTGYFFHANTGMTRVEFVPDGYLVVRFVNRTQHLPPELLSR
jgi:broad specificity phosphatase PhoE